MATKKKVATEKKVATKKRLRQVVLAVGGDEAVYEVSEITPATIRAAARDAGIGKFIVTVNGKAIETPMDFPKLKSKDYIKVLPYDEWAS